jgi:hypothetical protein
MLYIITLMQGGISVDWLGGYETYEECIYETRELEIGINLPNEAMVCLLEPPGVNGFY